MDWQTLLVSNGQTIVITTGLALGFLAISAYRIKARWGMFTEDREHEREQHQRDMDQEWVWETFDAGNTRSRKTEKEWTWGN